MYFFHYFEKTRGRSPTFYEVASSYYCEFFPVVHHGSGIILEQELDAFYILEGKYTKILTVKKIELLES